LQELLDELSARLLSLGAQGQLMIDGELAGVRPLDDAEALAAADPRKADAATMKAGDDAVVRNALAGGPQLRVHPSDDG
jgi:hypothetical protein